VVEARKSNKANRTRLKHALALRQYVPLQNTSDLRRAAIANDKCIVFTSPDGKFACSARKNQQKYHPGLRCMAVASEVYVSRKKKKSVHSVHGRNVPVQHISVGKIDCLRLTA
jgi:hypothetical protein